MEVHIVINQQDKIVQQKMEQTLLRLDNVSLLIILHALMMMVILVIKKENLAYAN